MRNNQIALVMFESSVNLMGYETKAGEKFDIKQFESSVNLMGYET